ncbi:hypothetical protein ACFWDI_26570 [Streptomyces sp. NPDC060064]|uniref:hypothetical protein n=1 Tax=Streptomyces sp. NPDC060064 TaxID=3347049 RepID=UPI0036B708BD
MASKRAVGRNVRQHDIGIKGRQSLSHGRGDGGLLGLWANDPHVFGSRSGQRQNLHPTGDAPLSDHSERRPRGPEASSATRTSSSAPAGS